MARGWVITIRESPTVSQPSRKPVLAPMIVDMLLQADKPLSSRAIASQIVTERGKEAGDRKHLDDMTTRVSRSLQNLRDQGRVTVIRGVKGHMVRGAHNSGPSEGILP